MTNDVAQIVGNIFATIANPDKGLADCAEEQTLLAEALEKNPHDFPKALKALALVDAAYTSIPSDRRNAARCVALDSLRQIVPFAGEHMNATFILAHQLASRPTNTALAIKHAETLQAVARADALFQKNVFDEVTGALGHAPSIKNPTEQDRHNLGELKNIHLGTLDIVACALGEEALASPQSFAAKTWTDQFVNVGDFNALIRQRPENARKYYPLIKKATNNASANIRSNAYNFLSFLAARDPGLAQEIPSLLKSKLEQETNEIAQASAQRALRKIRETSPPHTVYYAIAPAPVG